MLNYLEKEQVNVIKRYPTKKIYVGNVPIGADAPISIQSMTFTKTRDIEATIAQINRLQLAGCDIVRVAVPEEEDANALKVIKERCDIPIVADIHFNYKFALIAAQSVDCVRINPGNIGDKSRILEVVKACTERHIPIRIGVNGGSLEKHVETKYGHGANAMVQSALYNIKLLEDAGFDAIKVSLKSSDVLTTVEAYRQLRPLVDYPFHIGVTEAGTLSSSTIKSSVALGTLLLEGIGDTMRVSITGELEEEVRVAQSILHSVGLRDGLTIVSCPTCARLQSDLVSAVKEVEEKTAHIDAPLTLAVMGCAVNALGEAKYADVAIAYGKNEGLIIVKGEIVAKLKEKELLDRFLEEVHKQADKYGAN